MSRPVLGARGGGCEQSPSLVCTPGGADLTEGRLGWRPLEKDQVRCRLLGGFLEAGA